MSHAEKLRIPGTSPRMTTLFYKTYSSVAFSSSSRGMDIVE